MIDAAMTSVDANRSWFRLSSSSRAIALRISPASELATTRKFIELRLDPYDDKRRAKSQGC
jgi:hypothetical protein